MPYFIFTVTTNEPSNSRSAELVAEFESFSSAKAEISRLRNEQPLEENQSYKINFSASEAEAVKGLTAAREEPIAKEWEK